MFSCLVKELVLYFQNCVKTVLKKAIELLFASFCEFRPEGIYIGMFWILEFYKIATVTQIFRDLKLLCFDPDESSFAVIYYAL